MKRAFDIVVSAAGLVVLSPVLVALAVAVKVTSRGPVLYRAPRVGRYARPFRMMKFRSMVLDADRIGGPTTSAGDRRVTRVGAFMRAHKLDELPQLVNVLVGDMSLVGPRPEVLSELDAYAPDARRVFDVRPGMTDWASIWNADEGKVLAGAADPHAVYKARIQPTKIRLQLKYVDQASFGTDLRLIVYTVRKMLDRAWMPRELEPYGRP